MRLSHSATRRHFCLALGAGWASMQARAFAAPSLQKSNPQEKFLSLEKAPSDLPDISFAEAFTELARRDGWILVIEPFPSQQTISGEAWASIQKVDLRSLRLDTLASAFNYIVDNDRRKTTGLRLIRKQYGTNEIDSRKQIDPRYQVGPRNEIDPQLPLDITYEEWKSSLSDIHRIMTSFTDWGMPSDWLILHLVPSLTPEQVALMRSSQLTVASLSPEQKKIVVSMVNAFHSSDVRTMSYEIPLPLFDDKVWSSCLLTVEEMQGGLFRFSLAKQEKREFIAVIGQVAKTRPVIPFDRGLQAITAPLSLWAERLPRPAKRKPVQFSTEIADKQVVIVSAKESAKDYYRIFSAVADLYGIGVRGSEDVDPMRLRRASPNTGSGIYTQARSCLPLSIRNAYRFASFDNKASPQRINDVHDRVSIVPRQLSARVAAIAQGKIADVSFPTQTYSFESDERTASGASQTVTRKGWSLPVSALSPEETGAILGYFAAYIVANSATFLLRPKTPEYITRMDDLVLSGGPDSDSASAKSFKFDLLIADGPGGKIRPLLNASYNLDFPRYKKKDTAPK